MTAGKRDQDRLAELRANPLHRRSDLFRQRTEMSQAEAATAGSFGQPQPYYRIGWPGRPKRVSAQFNIHPRRASGPRLFLGKGRDLSNIGRRLQARLRNGFVDLQVKRSGRRSCAFVGELKCLKLNCRKKRRLSQTALSQAPSARAPSPDGLRPTQLPWAETMPPASELRAAEPASATLDDACKRDEDHLDRLRENRSREEAARFAEELSCERLRPQLLALVGDLAESSLPSAGDGFAGTDPAVKTNTASRKLFPTSRRSRRPGRIRRRGRRSPNCGARARKGCARRKGGHELECHQETPP